jgi:putative endonuclease
LINAAEAYILENDIDMETRFDLIAIELSHSGHKINHIEGAFFPTL